MNEQEQPQPEHPVTPLDVAILVWIARLGMLTVKQVMELMNMSKQAATNHTRNLNRHGLTRAIKVPAVAMLPFGLPPERYHAFGKAPHVHCLTDAGKDILLKSHTLTKDDIIPIPEYDAKHSLFLAHDVEIRDVFIWLKKVERERGDTGVIHWVIEPLITSEKGKFRPDAHFLYRTATKTYSCFVEVDRGTEKSAARWEVKAENYAGIAMDEAARIIVIAPTSERRDNIAGVLYRMRKVVSIPEGRYFLAKKDVIVSASLSAPVWRVLTRADLVPFEEE